MEHSVTYFLSFWIARLIEAVFQGVGERVIQHPLGKDASMLGQETTGLKEQYAKGRLARKPCPI